MRLYVERVVGDELRTEDASLSEIKAWLYETHQLVAVPVDLLRHIKAAGRRVGECITEAEDG